MFFNKKSIEELFTKAVKEATTEYLESKDNRKQYMDYADFQPEQKNPVRIYLSNREKKRIIQLDDKGYSHKQVAVRVGRSYATVKNFLGRLRKEQEEKEEAKPHGRIIIHSKKRHRIPLTSVQRERVNTLFIEKYDYKTIAKQLNKPATTVYNYLRRTFPNFSAK